MIKEVVTNRVSSAEHSRANASKHQGITVFGMFSAKIIPQSSKKNK